MKNNRLTLIIPFLNEKKEVDNTLNSIYSHKGNCDIDIIVINDASDDQFDYDYLQKKYDIMYICNTSRQGVARSRDIGVAYCKTPYFLLLDAHMRFYSDTWIDILVDWLEKDDRVLLCCQNRELEKVNTDIVDHGISTFGAYINMRTYDPKWILTPPSDIYSEVIEIPCVLGASYATSKKYWLYLKGLNGLRSYGLDESFLSFKVWMEGGKCLLLRNIEIGHIYRKKSPYHVPMSDMMYNKILISELLFPVSAKIHHIRMLCETESYEKDIFSILRSNKKEIIENIEYFSKICLQNKFDVLNRNYYDLPVIDMEIIQSIANTVILRHYTVSRIGLLNGKFGMIIFLSMYSKYTNNEAYDSIANMLLEESLENVNSHTGIGFAEGLSGIGWGLQYLCLHGYLSTDMSDLLSQIDKLIFSSDIWEKEDYSFEEGLSGVLYYFLSRLEFIEETRAIFNWEVYSVRKLLEVSRIMLACEQYFPAFIIPLNVISYFEHKSLTIDVLDIRELIVPSTLYLEEESSDLSIYSGLSGKGILAMLNNIVN